MKLPDFLIIGAMKAGTTSLYRDLLTNPRVFLPARKEPNNLTDDAVLTDAGLKEYAFHFQPATPDQICGEASTSYTKLPDFSGAPQRARKVLRPDLKLIYVVREPVSRVLSHHYHALSFGKLSTNVEEAIEQEPQLINWTRYATQAKQWIDVFGPESLRIIPFDTYIKARRETIADLSEFLGIEPRPDLVQVDEVYNKGDNKPLPKGPMAIIQKRQFYKRYVRRMIPVGAREKLRKTFFPTNMKRPDPPGPDTINLIIERLAPEMEELRILMGAPEPIWDVEKVRAKYAPAESPASA